MPFDCRGADNDTALVLLYMYVLSIVPARPQYVALLLMYAPAGSPALLSIVCTGDQISNFTISSNFTIRAYVLTDGLTDRRTDKLEY